MHAFAWECSVLLVYWLDVMRIHLRMAKAVAQIASVCDSERMPGEPEWMYGMVILFGRKIIEWKRVRDTHRVTHSLTKCMCVYSYVTVGDAGAFCSTHTEHTEHTGSQRHRELLQRHHHRPLPECQALSKINIVHNINSSSNSSSSVWETPHTCSMQCTMVTTWSDMMARCTHSVWPVGISSHFVIDGKVLSHCPWLSFFMVCMCNCCWAVRIEHLPSNEIYTAYIIHAYAVANRVMVLPVVCSLYRHSKSRFITLACRQRAERDSRLR